MTDGREPVWRTGKRGTTRRTGWTRRCGRRGGRCFRCGGCWRRGAVAFGAGCRCAGRFPTPPSPYGLAAVGGTPIPQPGLRPGPRGFPTRPPLSCRGTGYPHAPGGRGSFAPRLRTGACFAATGVSGRVRPTAPAARVAQARTERRGRANVSHSAPASRSPEAYGAARAVGGRPPGVVDRVPLRQLCVVFRLLARDSAPCGSINRVLSTGALRAHLLAARLAGPVATSREESLRSYRLFAARDPRVTLGLDPEWDWSERDLIALMADKCGVSAIPRMSSGRM